MITLSKYNKNDWAGYYFKGKGREVKEHIRPESTVTALGIRKPSTGHTELRTYIKVQGRKMSWAWIMCISGSLKWPCMEYHVSLFPFKPYNLTQRLPSCPHFPGHVIHCLWPFAFKNFSPPHPNQYLVEEYPSSRIFLISSFRSKRRPFQLRNFIYFSRWKFQKYHLKSSNWKCNLRCLIRTNIAPIILWMNQTPPLTNLIKRHLIFFLVLPHICHLVWKLVNWRMHSVCTFEELA